MIIGSLIEGLVDTGVDTGSALFKLLKYKSNTTTGNININKCIFLKFNKKPPHIIS
jgi:hypothetical protein